MSDLLGVRCAYSAEMARSKHNERLVAQISKAPLYLFQDRRLAGDRAVLKLEAAA